MTKRILFIITQSESGGAQRFVQTLVPHLDSSKYELLIAAGPGTGQTYPLLDTLEKTGQKVTRLKHLQREIRPIEDLRACFELKNLIKTFKPDVLFLNSSKAGVIGSLVSKFSIFNFPSNAKALTGRHFSIIYRIGGWSFNDPWPNWKKKLWIMLEKWTARYKDIIVVNNQHDLDQAKALDIRPRQRLELIHNGIDISELNFLPREEARLKLGLRPQDFVIGSIANFYPAKGLEYLIEAARLLNSKLSIRNFQLIIIGDGEERNKLEDLIAKYNLTGKIILAGRIDEARRYLKAFDLFVLPSVKEGFPWAVLEAMGAGLPVVATRVGAIPEIIQDSQNGLLADPGNSTQLADKIEQLLTNEKLRLSLGAEALQTVSTKFSLDKMVHQIENLLY